MCPDFSTLLNNTDAELLSRRLRHLLRSDRRREACRATSNYEDIKLH